ncbi:MAG: hypothetical protein M3P06_14140, partial [Acidobacteriota bacterium]|nr:hypothetical protein [Acidobacteriota bacterium]
PTPAQRENSAGKLFYTLGHVMHLVEDMAQPEHTRNDQHMIRSNLLDAAPSIYERFTHDLVTNPSKVNQGAFDAVAVMKSYPVVNDDSYSDFFSNDNSGMADFSNRNFVTQDTNFNAFDRGCPEFDYPQPSLIDASESVVTRSEEVRLGGPLFYTTATKLVDIKTLRHDVYDPHAAAYETDRVLTAKSFLDFESKLYRINSPEVYSLNDDGFLDHAKLLMPRAVGFAGGLLSHFFRAKIETTWAPGSTPYDFTLTIRNPGGEWIQNAEMRVYVRVVKPDVDILVPVFETTIPMLPPQNSIVTIPITITGVSLEPGERIMAFERRVVLRGQIGEEEDAVVATVHPATNTRLIVGRAMPVTMPGRIEQIAVDGDGTLELMLEGGRLGNPWWAFEPNPNNSTPIPRMSPDGRLIALRVDAPDRVGYAFNIVDASNQFAMRQIVPRTADGTRVYVEGLHAWSPGSNRIAAIAEMVCKFDEPCFEQVGNLKTGVAVIDVFSGITDFRFISTIHKDQRNNYKSGRPMWTASGQHFDLLTSTAGAPGTPGFLRYDLFANTVTPRVTPMPQFGALGIPAATGDGNRVFLVAGGTDTNTTGGLWIYEWTTNTWTIAAQDSADWLISPVLIVLSPQETEIAHMRRRLNSGCPGFYQLWIYDIATGIDRPISARNCGGFSGAGNFIDIFWPSE